MRAQLSALRQRMQARHVDMYLIGSEDFHGSEYVGDYFKCRAYVSGFTGSAGTLLVTQETAGLWTDGRYFLQAEDQLAGSGITLFKMGEEGVPTIQDYVEGHVKEGWVLGFDARTLGAREGQEYVRRLAGKKASVRGDMDLVGDIWKDRPPMASEPAWLMDVSMSGQSREERIANVREALVRSGSDLLILTSLDDIAWLLNFRGNDVRDNPVVLSYLMLDQDQVRLYVDQEKFKAADREILAEAGVIFRPYNDIYEDVAALDQGRCVRCDCGCTNYAIIERLPKGIRVKDMENPTLLPKAVKNPVEVENIRKAHIKDGVALTKFMYWLKHNIGKTPITEISAAEKMEAFRKAQAGYLEPSFEPISGYGVHGAIVHYSATPETDIPVEPHGLLLMDTGAQFMEGTTDITRTFVMGELTEDERKFFTLVLKGHLNLAGARFLHGCRGYNLDYLAREPLWQLGMDYNHGTGHGVGYLLNVHESPNGFRWRMLPGRNEGCVLEEGMVTSDEPGIYLEGRFGIRHESLMVCKKAEKTAYGQFMCFEVLTMVPFDLDGVDPSLMTEREKDLLNQYHRKVYETIGPQLDEAERAWLKEATRAI